jgi:hypothetical protein
MADSSNKGSQVENDPGTNLSKSSEEIMLKSGMQKIKRNRQRIICKDKANNSTAENEMQNAAEQIIQRRRIECNYFCVPFLSVTSKLQSIGTGNKTRLFINCELEKKNYKIARKQIISNISIIAQWLAAIHTNATLSLFSSSQLIDSLVSLPSTIDCSLLSTYKLIQSGRKQRGL